VDVQADLAGQADVGGGVRLDLQAFETVLPGRQRLGGQVGDGPVQRPG
jgi:hypothetical protein